MSFSYFLQKLSALVLCGSWSDLWGANHNLSRPWNSLQSPSLPSSHCSSTFCKLRLFSCNESPQFHTWLMVVKITVPAAVPEEDRAKVNNVIPPSLLLGCNHKSRRLINIVFTQKMWCVCPKLDYALLPFITSFLHIKATVGSNTQQKGLSTRRSTNVLQRCPSLNYISGNSGGVALSFKGLAMNSQMLSGWGDGEHDGIDSELKFACFCVWVHVWLLGNRLQLIIK